MSSIDDFANRVRKDEKSLAGKYPIIWKSTKCNLGECRDQRNTHRWSIPCGVPAGLMKECYDCHKTRVIDTNSEPDVWMIKKGASDYVKRRLIELNAQ